ncbi:hypothetical protein JXA02_11980 [candidate division KSB1 bacterium]|nr:hypothetical protein [candidate division KSB1 bacterium]
MNPLNSVATKQDLNDLRDELKLEFAKFATKNDLKRFATKDDLKNFATKDDLKRFATKDDLKNFATKDDLKNSATKDDLKAFAKKDDLKNFITRDDAKDFARKKDLDKLTAQVAVNTVEIVNIKSELRGVHTKLDHIIEVLSDVVGDLKDNQIERAATNVTIDRHQSILDNHEKRISHLEQKPTRIR